MIESGTAQGPDWLPQLRGLVGGSAHETRNALNGLVVNLEVVRSRLARIEELIGPFLADTERLTGLAVALHIHRRGH